MLMVSDGRLDVATGLPLIARAPGIGLSSPTCVLYSSNWAVLQCLTVLVLGSYHSTRELLFVMPD